LERRTEVAKEVVVVEEEEEEKSGKRIKRGQLRLYRKRTAVAHEAP